MLNKYHSMCNPYKTRHDTYVKGNDCHIYLIFALTIGTQHILLFFGVSGKVLSLYQDKTVDSKYI